MRIFKIILFFTALLFSASCESQFLINNYNHSGTDVFVIVGDSKSLGGGEVAGPTPISGTVYEWNRSTDEVQMVINSDVIGAVDGSPWPQFAINYNATTGRKVILIPCGSSGAEFSPNGDNNNWSSSGTLYSAMIDDVNACLSATGIAKVSGVLVVLGINDQRASTTLSTVHSDMESFVTRLNSDLDTPEIYFSMPGRSESATNLNARMISIRSKLRDIAEDNANCHIALTEISFAAWGLYSADNLHFGQTGNNKIGELFNRYISINKNYSKPARTVISSFYSEISSTRKGLIETFINSQISSGNWDQIDSFQWSMAADINDVYTDWRLITCRTNSGAVLSANNELQTDGTTSQYSRIQFSPTLSFINASSSDFAVTIRTGSVGSQSSLPALFGGTTGSSSIYLFNNTGPFLVYRGLSTTNVNATSHTSIQANTMYSVGRNAGDQILLINGSLDKTSTNASGTITNHDIFIGAHNNNGTASAPWNGGTKFSSVHKHTTFNYSSFYSAVETLISNW